MERLLEPEDGLPAWPLGNFPGARACAGVCVPPVSPVPAFTPCLPMRLPLLAPRQERFEGGGFSRQVVSDPCDPMPGSSVHGISQTSIVEWVAISFSGGSSRPRDLNPGPLPCRRALYHLNGWREGRREGRV